MSQTTIIAGQVLTPEGFVPGRLHCTAAIRRFEPTADAPADRFVLPGFIDLHVHGGGGADCMAGADAVRRMARFHAGHGTTALLATTVTAPRPDLLAAFRGIGAAMAAAADGAARILGVHLEGPFISPKALGAQPPFAIAPDLDLVDELATLAPIRVATMAPEIDQGGALLAHFSGHGVRAQIGHTTCSYAQAQAALAAGAAGFTHLFNAMSGLHHRRAGAVGAALAHAQWAELILDFVHVEAAAARVALRAIPDLYCVTDAVAATGMPPGEYRLGQHRIVKDADAARLEDGTLAGSVLTMDRALRNLLHLGVPLEQAAKRCATLQADYLGLEDRGRLVQGAVADAVVVDPKGRVEAVLAEGRPIRGAN
ncbi:MAG: N-acetylglucosamine-6-phosphate deacetylase [Geminicoccaceae bacterium]